jgi:energy-converting hydrogenase Eha subunit E
MSGVKISALPAATSLSATADAIPIVNSTVTKKTTPSLLAQTMLQNFSGFLASVDYAQWNVGATTTSGVGKIRWDSANGCLQYGLVGGNVESKIGQTLVAYVNNAETTSLVKGEAVYLFGSTGNRATVKRASNTSEATSAKCIGIVAETIAPNQTGFIVCKGVIEGLNLGAYTAGQTLYIGATAGTLTATKPVAPAHMVYAGIVERANSGNGQLFVIMQNGYELDELHDVLITSELDGDALVYESATSLWKNKQLAGILGVTIGNGSSNQMSFKLNETFNMVGGSNVVMTYNDVTNTITISASGTISGSVAWVDVTGKPNTISGFGITDGVSTGGSYANPSWITGLAFNKISSLPSTLNGYGITDAQPLDVDLTAIAALAGTAGFLKTNGVGIWSVDISTYRTDSLYTWTTAQRGTVTTDNDLSFDLSATNNFKCTPTALGTLTFTNIAAGIGQSGHILLVNTGGYAISKAATTLVGSSFLSTISAAGTYLISYFCDGTNVYCTNSGAMT